MNKQLVLTLLAVITAGIDSVNWPMLSRKNRRRSHVEFLTVSVALRECQIPENPSVIVTTALVVHEILLDGVETRHHIGPQLRPSR
jgi:hypothetical protein